MFECRSSLEPRPRMFCMPERNELLMLYGVLVTGEPFANVFCTALQMLDVSIGESSCGEASVGSSGMLSMLISRRAVSSGCLDVRCASRAVLARNRALQNGQRLWMSC